MITVNDILQHLESLAPLSLKMEWDKVGLLCGSGNTPVTKVLVALDPFEHVCQEAADWGAELIVTHHPLIFHPLPNVTDETSIGREILTLCRHGISAINAHTNLDCAEGGVNDVLAQKLGLSNISVIPYPGIDGGLLRCGLVPEQSLETFLSHVKNALGCQGLRFVDGGKPVHKVAVGGGSCGDEMLQALDAGCDTFVTADIKYNQFWDGKDLGINLIDAGHFCTENPVIHVIAAKIAEKFPVINGYDYISIVSDRSDSRGQKSSDTVWNLSFSSSVRGKTIVLFDDITTRGTSFIQVASKLKEKGAANVIGFFLGKTVAY